MILLQGTCTIHGHRSGDYLAPMMLLEETFPCSRDVVDPTDQGTGTAAWLAGELGADQVEQFLFTGPSKSRAGFTRLTMCGTVRCTVYAPGEDKEATMHRSRFLREVEVAGSDPALLVLAGKYDCPGRQA